MINPYGYPQAAPQMAGQQTTPMQQPPQAGWAQQGPPQPPQRTFAPTNQFSAQDQSQQYSQPQNENMYGNHGQFGGMYQNPQMTPWGGQSKLTPYGTPKETQDKPSWGSGVVGGIMNSWR